MRWGNRKPTAQQLALSKKNSLELGDARAYASKVEVLQRKYKGPVSVEDILREGFENPRELSPENIAEVEKCLAIAIKNNYSGLRVEGNNGTTSYSTMDRTVGYDPDLLMKKSKGTGFATQARKSIRLLERMKYDVKTI